MAKYKGILPLSGTVGGVTFVKTPHGTIVRAKSSLNKKKFYSYASFEAARQTSREFGHSSLMSGTIRRAFLPVAKIAKDYATHYRLNKLMGEVVKTDTVHERGARVMTSGDMSILKGFEWNKKYQFCTIFRQEYMTNLNAITGTMRIVVPAFSAQRGLKKPKGATHYQVVTAGMAMRNRKDALKEVRLERSDVLEIGKDAGEELNFDLSVAVRKGDVLVMGMGVVFYQKVGAQYYDMKENACFALVETGICDKGARGKQREEEQVVPMRVKKEKGMALGTVKAAALKKEQVVALKKAKVVALEKEKATALCKEKMTVKQAICEKEIIFSDVVVEATEVQEGTGLPAREERGRMEIERNLEDRTRAGERLKRKKPERGNQWRECRGNIVKASDRVVKYNGLDGEIQKDSGFVLGVRVANLQL